MEFHFAQNSTRDKQILYYLTLVCRWKIKRLNEHFIIIHFKTVPLMDDLILCLPAPPFRLSSITSVIHQVSCSRNCGTLDFPDYIRRPVQPAPGTPSTGLHQQTFSDGQGSPSCWWDSAFFSRIPPCKTWNSREAALRGRFETGIWLQS